MRKLAISWLVLVCATVSGVAIAQQSDDTLSTAATSIYDACRQNQHGTPTECACAAGFYAGRLQEDEYRVLSVLNQYIGSDGKVTDMQAARQAMRDAATRWGISDQRFTQIMQRFSSMNVDGGYGDRACVPLRDR